MRLHDASEMHETLRVVVGILWSASWIVAEVSGLQETKEKYIISSRMHDKEIGDDSLCKYPRNKGESIVGMWSQRRKYHVMEGRRKHSGNGKQIFPISKMCLLSCTTSEKKGNQL